MEYSWYLQRRLYALLWHCQKRKELRHKLKNNAVPLGKYMLEFRKDVLRVMRGTFFLRLEEKMIQTEERYSTI